MYQWSDIKRSALAKLDLTEEEADIQNLINKFPIYANEAMTQICSTVKPKWTFATFVITNDDIEQGNNIKTMPDDFICFGGDVCTRTYKDYKLSYLKNDDVYVREECHDDDFDYEGYNQVMFKKEGEYKISYNARWIDFLHVPTSDGKSTTQITDDYVLSSIPQDILDCLPSYIASQCFKIDDEYKSSVFRNEYEMFMARINDTNYQNTRTFFVGGDW